MSTARALAEAHYYVPEAAALLLEAAASSERSEQRIRAQHAVRALAYDQDILDWPDESTPPEWARAIARACVEAALYLAHGLDRRGRERVARLLGELCQEAERLRALRQTEGAA